MTKELVGEYPFDIDARIPLQLGRESISSSMVAFIEIVKNAYDADANKVSVNMDLDPSGVDSVIVIEDDGHGMDENNLRDNWLVIGTDDKRGKTHTKNKNRVLTGEKGLGRLGLDRLSQELIVQTKTKEMHHLLELHIHWDEYEELGQRLSDVKHRVFKIPRENIADISANYSLPHRSGTRLILRHLKDNWSKEKQSDLENELALLVSPYRSRGGFDISMSVNGECRPFDEAHVPYDKPIWTMKATLNENHTISGSLLYGPDDLSVKIDERPWNQWMKSRGTEPLCGPFEFELRYIPWEPEVLKDFEFNKKRWTRYMEQNQGVRIYRDYFRVKPYGEPKGRGDWLNLGSRAVRSPGGIAQGGWKVGPHQVIGAVFISKISNPGLIDQLNREGILEETPYEDLRATVLSFIEYFEREATRVARSQRDNPDKGSQADSLREEIEVHKAKASQTLKAVDQLAKSVRTADNRGEQDSIAAKIEATVKEAENAIAETLEKTKKLEGTLEEEKRELSEEKNTLGNLASLGILTVAFGHEAVEKATNVSAGSRNLVRLLDQGYIELLRGSKKAFLRQVELIVKNTGFIQGFSEFSLGNIRVDKRKRRKLKISEPIHTVFNALKDSLRERNIEVDLTEVDTSIPSVRAFPIDWECIIVNFITNAINALDRTVGKANRRIRVVLRARQDEQVELRFMDSGKGLESGSEDAIFEPMFSTRRNEKGDVIGTGMGLTLVKTFVEKHSGGSISFLSPGELGGAEFVIQVPVANKEV